MVTAESFSDYVYKMGWDERERYLRELAKWKHGGMTYEKMASILGGYASSSVAKQVRTYLEDYKRLLDRNFAKLEESLKKNDPDYDYITDRRTVLQEMCALHMGGEEIINTLKQLMHLEQT